MFGHVATVGNMLKPSLAAATAGFAAPCDAGASDLPRLGRRCPRHD